MIDYYDICRVATELGTEAYHERDTDGICLIKVGYKTFKRQRGMTTKYFIGSTYKCLESGLRRLKASRHLRPSDNLPRDPSKDQDIWTGAKGHPFLSTPIGLGDIMDLSNKSWFDDPLPDREKRALKPPRRIKIDPNL